MKHTVISIILLLMLSSSASALIFTFDYSDTARVGESFSVSLSAETTNTYDVKIFVSDSDGKIISQIYNEGWKNPYYYVKSVFPEKSEFDIKITNYSSEATICARLRKTESSSFTEECGSIEIIEEEQDEAEKEEKPEENIIQPVPEEAPAPDFVLSPSEEQPQEQLDRPERIHLNPKAKESTKKFTTTDDKLRLFALYAFTGLVVLIVIFLIFKKL